MSELPFGSVMISTENSISVDVVYDPFPVSTKVPWKVPGQRA